MSYILDALKKAAEQRSGPPPEVRRLLSPAPVAAAPPARYVAVAAAAAGAIAVAAIVWMWPGPTAPTPVGSLVAVPAPVAEKPRAPIAEMSRAPLADTPRAPIAAIESVPSSDAPRTTPRVATTKPRALVETRRPLPLVVSPPMGTPVPPLIASVPPASIAPRTDVAKLRVEVIVYSDQRPLRWAYISGRRYVEGDAIGDGARVEEIQSNSIILVEDGRRITLRP